MSGVQNLDEFAQFYGGVPLARILVQGTFEDDDYIALSKKARQSCIVEQLLRAENYTDVNNVVADDGTRMSPADIHYSLPDLVITAALLHRAIDKPTRIGTNLGDLLDNLEKALANAVNKSREDFITLMWDSSDPAGVRLGAQEQLRCSEKESWCYKEIIANVSVSNAFGDLAKTAGISRDDTLPDISRALHVAFGTVVAQLRRERENVSGLSTIEDYKNRYAPKYFEMLQKEMSESVKLNVLDKIKRKTDLPYTTLGTSVPDVAFNYFKELYGNYNNMSASARKFLDANLAVMVRGETDLYDKSKQREQDLQYGWIRLTQDEVSALVNKINSLDDGQKKSIRMNLMKTSQGATETRAQAFFPDVPSGRVWYSKARGYGYVPGRKPSILRDVYKYVYGDDKAELRELMPDVDENLNTRSRVNNLNYGIFMSNVTKCELEKAKTAASEPEKSESADDVFGDYPLLQYADLPFGKIWTYDTTTGQFYKNVDGQRVPYTEAVKNNPENCYSTYLSAKGDAKCISILDCLIDEDPKSLNRCIKLLDDPDMWKLAEYDALANVAPDKIVAVFKKFGVENRKRTDANGKEYIVPMSYREWQNDVVSKWNAETKNAVFKNTKLQEYIRGLITVANNNPAVLNKHVPEIVARDMKPESMRDLGMQRYRNLSVVSKDSFSVLADMLQNLPRPVDVLPSAYNVITSGNMANVSFFSPFTTPSPVQMGGNLYASVRPAFQQNYELGRAHQSSTTLKSVFSTLYANLRNAGLEVHPDDKRKIATAMLQIEKYEKQLAELAVILNSISRSAHAFGIDLTSAARSQTRTIPSLKHAVSKEDINDFLLKYVKDVSKSMATNVNIQQRITYDLLNGVASRFARECAEKTDGSKKEYSRFADM